MVLQAVQSGGARVVSESAPHSMKLSKSKGGFRYDGRLQLQPLGPAQTAVRLSFKPSSGAIAVVAISGLVGVMTMPLMLGSLGALVSLGITGWLLWSMTRGEPPLMAEAVLSTLPQGNGSYGAPASYGPQRNGTTPPVPVAPPAPPASGAVPGPPSAPVAAPQSFAPPAAQASDAGGDGEPIPFERLKQLAELRALGAISSEEFDLKKAELLKRL